MSYINDVFTLTPSDISRKSIPLNFTPIAETVDIEVRGYNVELLYLTNYFLKKDEQGYLRVLSWAKTQQCQGMNFLESGNIISVKYVEDEEPQISEYVEDEEIPNENSIIPYSFVDMSDSTSFEQEYSFISSDGDWANIKLGIDVFKIENSDNFFVWDSGGENECVFTEENEEHMFVSGGFLVNIVFLSFEQMRFLISVDQLFFDEE